MSVLGSVNRVASVGFYQISFVLIRKNHREFIGTCQDMARCKGTENGENGMEAS